MATDEYYAEELARSTCTKTLRSEGVENEEQYNGLMDEEKAGLSGEARRCAGLLYEDMPYGEFYGDEYGTKKLEQEAADKRAAAEKEAADKELKLEQEGADPSNDPNAPVQGPAEGSRHYLTDGIINFLVLLLCLYAVFGGVAFPASYAFPYTSPEVAQRALAVLRSLAVGFFVSLMFFVQFGNLYKEASKLGVFFMVVAGLLAMYLMASALYGFAYVGGERGVLHSKSAQYGVGLVSLLALCANCIAGSPWPKSFPSFWLSLIAVVLLDFLGFVPDGGAALQLQRAFGVVVVSNEETARSTTESIASLKGLFDFGEGTAAAAETEPPPAPTPGSTGGKQPVDPLDPVVPPTTYVAKPPAKPPATLPEPEPEPEPPTTPPPATRPKKRKTTTRKKAKR